MTSINRNELPGRLVPDQKIDSFPKIAAPTVQPHKISRETPPSVEGKATVSFDLENQAFNVKNTHESKTIDLKTTEIKQQERTFSKLSQKEANHVESSVENSNVHHPSADSVKTNGIGIDTLHTAAPKEVEKKPNLAAQIEEKDKPLPQPKVVTVAETEQLLKSTKLLFKTVGNYENPRLPSKHPDSIFQDQKWKYLVSQMKNPEEARNTRRLETDKKNAVKIVYDPKNLGIKVDRENFYTGTRKTATSLLPPDGKMTCFPGSVGMLFNSDLCEIKDKYVWEKDAATLKKDWKRTIEREEWDSFSAHDQLKMVMSESQLVESQRNASNPLPFNQLQASLNAKPSDEISEYNEVLASVKKESLTGVFYATESAETGNPPSKLDLLESRLSAISKKCYIKNELNVDVPIFEKTNEGLSSLDKEAQHKIIESCLNSDETLNSVATHQHEIISSRTNRPPSIADVKQNLILKLKTMQSQL